MDKFEILIRVVYMDAMAGHIEAGIGPDEAALALKNASLYVDPTMPDHITYETTYGQGATNIDAVDAYLKAIVWRQRNPPTVLTMSRLIRTWND